MTLLCALSAYKPYNFFFCFFVHMHLIYACNIHSFSLARICRIECFRHAPSYLVTRTAFPRTLSSQLSPYDREMAQLPPQDAQAPDGQQPLQPQPPAPAAVAAVAIKLPPFWPADPLVWFAQIEAQFATRNITNQRTRFDYVVAALSNEYATEIRDIILNPPQEDAYSTLKDLLIKRTAASERKRLQLLFTAEELGDRKPTQLLRRMQQLMGDAAGPDLDNSFLRELFFQRLPSHVRMVLASSGDNVSLDTLAEMADKIMEVALPTVTSVTAPAPAVAPPPPATISSEVAELQAEITELRQLLSSLQISSHRASHSGSRPPSRTTSRASSPTPPQGQGLCWYHRRFGDKAQKCTSCSWSGNGRA